MKPMKVKVFTDCSDNINIPNELRLNDWLAENPGIEIVDILQSESMVTRGEGAITRNLSITVFYRE